MATKNAKVIGAATGGADPTGGSIHEEAELMDGVEEQIDKSYSPCTSMDSDPGVVSKMIKTVKHILPATQASNRPVQPGMS